MTIKARSYSEVITGLIDVGQTDTAISVWDAIVTHQEPSFVVEVHTSLSNAGGLDRLVEALGRNIGSVRTAQQEHDLWVNTPSDR
jgi:hypothetical protein